jgi:hypothetical protein
VSNDPAGRRRHRTVARAQLGAITASPCSRAPSVARTAAEVGVSQSHLSKLVKAEIGLTAGQIARAWTLTDPAQKWRAEVPPRSGTKMYWKRLDEWQRLEREPKKLLSVLPTDSPLRSWANLVLSHTRRPDFRTQPYRERVWGERRRERDRERQALENVFRWWRQQQARSRKSTAAPAAAEASR